MPPPLASSGPPPLPDLPVRALLPDLQAALAEEGVAVLEAPPGAGKTTLVPLELLRAPWLRDRKVLLLEPRRLAARAAAWRMTDLLGEPQVGGTVGYRMRLDTRVGPGTRIEVVTEGILARMLQRDPALEGVGALLFDEFHERSLHADLGLALALSARELLRPDLRIVVMSATLEGEGVAALLSDPPAPILRSQGRRFPVEVRWAERPARALHPRGWIEPVAARQVERALADEEGDILVFLPGAAEIRRTAEALEVGPEVDLYQLHGSLPRELQDRALRPAPPGRRKVVLASAVAETSLTIEGVTVVVDSGLMRVPRFDPGSGMTRLDTVRVTRDTAEQRTGRAGRLGPGVCYRLWTRAEDRGLVPARRPEILEADLAGLFLELAAWGTDPGELSWLDPPPTAGVEAARTLLAELGALDREGRLTAHGRAMAELGTHPRLAHLLLSARELGAVELGCEVAALLEERDPVQGVDGPPDADLRLRVEALRSRGGGHVPLPGHRVDRGSLARARQMASHFGKALGTAGARPGGSETGDLAQVGLLVATAWPDRVARLRGGDRYLLSGGRGAVLEGGQTLAGTPWLAVAEVEDRGPDARIRQAAPLDPEEALGWLDHRVEEGVEIRWNADGGRVEADRVRRLGAIEVSRGRLADPDPERVARTLALGLRESGIEALPWTRESRRLRDRLAFLHHLEPEEWPDVSDQALLDEVEDWLLPFAPGARSLADLAPVELGEALLARAGWELRSRLETLAPSRIEVPSGSSIALDYENPEAPVLAARLQELFGMRETPRVGGGRVPVTVHILSPARRPVQVTRDLESFWREGYFQVRKDLRGRYPKHFWPEDPLTAPAIRGVRPRRDDSGGAGGAPNGGAR